MKIFTEVIYFIFPLLLAGLVHHLIIIKYNLFSFLSKPIDNNTNYKGKPLFGKSKTWRGFIIVPILSSIGSIIISYIIPIQTNLPPFLVGLLLGFGYAIAELPNSFIKRRLNIQAGEKTYNKFFNFFLIFDQIDSVIGSILVLLFIYPASLTLCLLILIIGGLLHLFVDLYLYKYGYKQLRKNGY
jgi:CDP-diglyceride synthetase